MHPERHGALAFSESQADGVDVLEIAADEACDARGEDGRVLEGEDFCQALVVIYIHGGGLSPMRSEELRFGYPNSAARSCVEGRYIISAPERGPYKPEVTWLSESYPGSHAI